MDDASRLRAVLRRVTDWLRDLVRLTDHHAAQGIVTHVDHDWREKVNEAIAEAEDLLGDDQA